MSMQVTKKQYLMLLEYLAKLFLGVENLWVDLLVRMYPLAIEVDAGET